MSNTSDIYDAINSLMTTLFPNKYQLADSVVIDNNDELFLQDGYAIYFGPAINTRRQVGCKMSIQRSVMITLTKAVRATHKDLSIIKTCEKALLEDEFTLIQDFDKNEAIGNLIAKRDWLSDNGIERILGESKKFVMIECLFQIEYFENLA